MAVKMHYYRVVYIRPFVVGGRTRGSGSGVARSGFEILKM